MHDAGWDFANCAGGLADTKAGQLHQDATCPLSGSRKASQDTEHEPLFETIAKANISDDDA
jgi:hypothetical protein